jgi:gas vesicle protein
MSTTNPNDPDALRREIEETRANLSQNVNALGEAVQPSNIAKRQVSKVTGAATGVKDKIMGSAEDTVSTISGKASDVGGSVTGTVSGAGSAVTGSVSSAGQTAKTQAQGNPLAAGLIALGAGWLLGSLLPASSKERQAAAAVKEQATPLVGQAQDMAKEVAKETAQELKEPAMSAAESIKSTAQDAAETVKAEGQSAVEDVKSSAQESKDNVQGHQSAPGTSL